MQCAHLVLVFFSTILQGTKVILNIYDLTPANDALWTVGFGLHHSGVEIMVSAILDRVSVEARGIKVNYRDGITL